MVADFLGDGADRIGEGQSVAESAEQEDAFQLHVVAAYLDVPVGNLADQLGQFFVGYLGRIGAAGFALGLGEGGHGVGPFGLLGEGHWKA